MNTDTISRLCFVTELNNVISIEEMEKEQQADDGIKNIFTLLKRRKTPNKENFYSSCLKRYKQIRHQLIIQEGILYRRYSIRFNQTPELFVLVPKKIRKKF